MEILDADDPSNIGDDANDPSQPGQDKDKLPEAAPLAPRTEDRKSETPKGPKDSEGPARASPDAAPGESSFRKYQGIPPKVRVGYPCLNCEHTHRDHSYYDKKLCLIDDCECVGLIIDPKVIPSRMD